MSRIIKAATGSKISCATWEIEAASRMLDNNLDPDVGEDPANLIVYGGQGKAARSWEAYDAIQRTLRTLKANETLLIQSGKPVGVLKTWKQSPRVIIANSNLVGHWATQEHFDHLDQLGLIMFGQMTAGSWIYIGTQGILQGTWETFAVLAQQHFGGSLKGRLTLTAGAGGMGGAQPLSVTMNEGVCLMAEMCEERIQKRLDTRYLDAMERDLDTAIQRALTAKEDGKPLSICWLGNAGDLLKALLDKGIIPDVVTDQTSAHDVLNGYYPMGLSREEADELRTKQPDEYRKRAMASMAKHVRLILELKERGAVAFDYGNNLRKRAFDAGVENAFDYPGFVPAYIRPEFCKGRGPFRMAALSGNPKDIFAIDEALMNLFPNDKALHRWLKLAGKNVAFQGLPCRICWLGLGERDVAGLLINKMVRNGQLKAPIVIGRDHLDCGSVASPYRETEAMMDGSDAVADWPMLNYAVAVASGASWTSQHHGGGVGIGFAQHSGLVIVCDGTKFSDGRIARALFNDPATGIIRHADAGYQEAIECAKANGVQIPMLN